MKSSLTRARWAAIGAAVAVSLGGGVVMVAHAGGTPTYVSSDFFQPVEPCRFNDTRGTTTAEQTAGIVYQEVGKLGAGLYDTLDFNGVNRGYCNDVLPADTSMSAVVLNVTVTQGNATSYLTIYPSNGQPRPLVSSINWVNNGVDVANNVIMPLGDLEEVEIYNNLGSVHYVVDVVGYFTDTPPM